MRNLHALALGTAVVLGSACSPIRPARYPALPPGVAGTSITRADAIADLNSMMGTLERVHPDLYAVRGHELVDQECRRIVTGLPDSLSRLDWWMKLAPLVASLGDGHTNIGLPWEELTLVANDDYRLFPADVAVDEERRLIVVLPNSPDSGLKRGDRILTVNGHDARALIDEWSKDFSGESDMFRATIVGDLFRNLLAIHSIAPPYTLTAESADGTKSSVEMAGITRGALAERRKGLQSGQAGRANFAYRMLEPGIGYMNFFSMGGDRMKFNTELAVMFRQVASDGDKSLIVDLRSNGGGDSQMGDELLRYITTKQYRQASRKDWKMSAEYRAFIKTMVRPPLNWLPAQEFSGMGRKLFHGPAGIIVTFEEKPVTPKRAEPFFAGPVCVLIGPRTFSSAADLADGVKTYHLATLIGDETGGRVNTFGEVYPFRLPHSRLSVSVSSARFVRASGDLTDSGGVVPDIVVRPTAEDRKASRDPVLDRARRCGLPD